MMLEQEIIKDLASPAGMVGLEILVEACIFESGGCSTSWVRVVCLVPRFAACEGASLACSGSGGSLNFVGLNKQARHARSLPDEVWGGVACPCRFRRLHRHICLRWSGKAL